MINLLGLSLLLFAGIVILVYASYERSFDRHIPAYQRTYRIITTLGEGKYWTRSFACFADALADSPEIESMTSFIPANNSRIRIGEREFNVPEAVIADTAFMDFFGIEIIAGRKEDLGLPNTVFLTSDIAKILFPEGDALGKGIFLDQMEGNTNDSLGLFNVSAILKPMPGNTHFGFQMIFSQKGNFSRLVNQLKMSKGYGANVYLRLYDNNTSHALETKLKDAPIPYLSKSQGPPVHAFNSRLQPVREIHYTPDLNREPRPVIPKSILYLLFSVGGLIIILICINFLSMSIVQSLGQRMETGIMKTLGANNFSIFKLYLLRVILLVGASLVLAWIMILMSGQMLDNFFESGWDPEKLSGKILIFSLVVGIIVSSVAAIAMYYTNALKSPVDLIRGKLPSGKKMFNIIGTLLLVQFGIVVFLSGFSLMIERQLKYVDNKDLGYNPENTLIVRIPGRQPGGSFLLEELRKHSSIISVSTVHHHPGDIYQHMDFKAGETQYPFEFRMVDQSIFNTLGIKLLKTFIPPDSELKGWVINETFYNRLHQDFSEEDISTGNFGLEDVSQGDTSKTRFLVAGVMSDFHYSSLYDRVGNFAFAIRNPETNYNRWLVLRFQEGQYNECLSILQDMMDTYFPGRPIESFLLSENLASKYASSKKLSRIISLFTLLSILISVFGLYGLTAYVAQQKTKEIGIRKVFGASTIKILAMINLKFLKLVALSFTIACPLTYMAMNKWLQSFAYKSSPSAFIFILSGFLVTGIVLVCVSWQIANVSRQNPVDSIRYE